MQLILDSFLFPVGKPPKVISSMKDVKVTVPNKATMKAEISPGEPRATIRWFKDAKEVYASRKYEMSYSGDTAKLDINPTELLDASVYRCEADNKVARVETEAKLIVCCK